MNKEPKHAPDCTFQLEQGGGVCDCGYHQREPKAEPGELKYCKEHRTIHCSCQQREIERLEAKLKEVSQIKYEENLEVNEQNHAYQERIKELKVELADAKSDTKLWQLRTIEAADAVADYEETKADNKRLLYALAACGQHLKHCLYINSDDGDCTCGLEAALKGE